MKTKEKTCEQLIGDRLKSRLAYLLPDFDDMGLKELHSYAQDVGIVSEDLDESDLREKLEDEHRDHILENVLSVDKTIVYDICLSTGGPADSIELHYYQNGELSGGCYVYQDWFDGARRKLDYRTAEQLADLFAVGPYFK